MEEILKMKKWMGKTHRNRTIENYEPDDSGEYYDITCLGHDDADLTDSYHSDFSEESKLFALEYLTKVKIVNSYINKHMEWNHDHGWHIDFANEYALSSTGVTHIQESIELISENLDSDSTRVDVVFKRLNDEFNSLMNVKRFVPNWKFNKMMLLPLIPLAIAAGVIVKKKV